jgi:lactococcin 972 family bacteriocin
MRRLVLAAVLFLTVATAGPVLADNVGGGTWYHGSYYSGWPIPTHYCYSQYHNWNYYHSATAVISGQSMKVYASAGNWANAWQWGNLFDTCLAYWQNYP